MPLASDGGTQEFFLARQSILDRSQNLHAFELLFRAGPDNQAVVGTATAATAAVISHTLSDLSLQSLLGNYRAFINFGAEVLMSDLIELLPRDRAVIEILETVEPTAEIVARCRYLREQGFCIAMDDFAQYSGAFEPLLNVAHIVKVDLQLLDDRALQKVVTQLRRFNVQLLAEKVDNRARFSRCLDLGFDYFQGYYFAEPELIAGKRLSRSEMVVMRLIGLLMTDADTLELEKVLKQDPGLSVNLLRLVNSVGTGGNGAIHSLASALMVLGRRQLLRWLQLTMFAAFAPGKAFPSPLMQLAATRGKFMELMVAGDRMAEDHAFMVGIMSLMDALLGMPLASILDELPIAREVRIALLERRGRMGQLLQLAEALERGDAGLISARIAAVPGASAAMVGRAQTEALGWANRLAQPAG